MAKQTGLGQALYVNGVDLSGDTGALDSIHGGVAPIDVTGINKSAYERVGGRHDGGFDFTAFFNDAASAAHLTLRNAAITDYHYLVCHAASVGGAGFAMIGKQLDYSGTRGADGALTFSVPTVGNGYALDMAGGGGDGMLTAGKRTDGAPANGASLDYGATNTLFGAASYLQVFALTGTNVIVTIADSANDSTFAAITGLTHTSVTTVPNFEHLETSRTATIRRYVRAQTTGTFSSATFAVLFVRFQAAP